MLDKIKKTEGFLLAVTIAWDDYKDKWITPSLRQAIIEVKSAYKCFERARAEYEQIENQRNERQD